MSPAGTPRGPPSVAPEHANDGITLLAEMVREPRLDTGEFDRLKAERLADILQARADPGRLADEMFLRHLFDDSRRTAGCRRERPRRLAR